MKDNIIEFIEDVFGIFIFMLAITVFVSINYKSNENINILTNRLKNNGSIYEVSVDSQLNSLLGSEIIGQIINGLEYDIQVEGTLIQANEDIRNIDVSKIELNALYKVNEVLNQDGKIIKIYYTKE